MTTPQPGVWKRMTQAFGRPGRSKRNEIPEESPVDTNTTEKDRKDGSLLCGMSRRKGPHQQNKAAKIDHSSKLNQKKNPNVHGTVAFVKNAQSDMWDKIVKQSMCGTNIVAKAVVCNASSRKIYAYEPADFTPSTEQCQKVIEILDAHSQGREVTRHAFKVAEDEFEVVKFDENGILVAKTVPQRPEETVERAQGNLVGFKTDFILMLGACAPCRLDAARELLKDMREYSETL